MRARVSVVRPTCPMVLAIWHSKRSPAACPLGEVIVAGYPFKFSAQPELPELYAPRLGEHNAEVLQRVLGYDDAMVAELVARGVLQSGSR